MRYSEISNEDKLEIPDLEIGDQIKSGKWKNKKKTITGLKTDDKGQPVLKTNKGDEKLFKSRITKLMIDESFDNPYVYQWQKGNSQNWIGEFKTDTNEYIDFRAAPIGKDFPDRWDVEFTRGGSVKATGDGDAFRIFATVIEMIQDFMNVEEPEEFSFIATTETKGRVSLYKRLAAKIGSQSKEHGPYTVTSKDRAQSTIFKFQKNY